MIIEKMLKNAKTFCGDPELQMFKKKCQIVVNYKIYAIKTGLTLYFENNTFLG